MKHLYIIICIIAILSACSQDKENNSTQHQTFKYKDSLDIELTLLAEKQIIPGFAVAVVNADGPMFQKSYGFADTKTQVYYENKTRQIIASVSKTFIGVALMKLVEQGKINLDDPINTYTPFDIKNPWQPDIPITIRMLATHTSSIDDYDDGDESTYWLIDPIPEPRDEIPKDVLSRLEYFELGEPRSLATTIEYALSKDGRWYDQGNFYKYAPGTTMNYSNIGASLAAYIIELVSGQSFESYTEEHIFKPLDMNSTTWHYNDSDTQNLSTIYLAFKDGDKTKTYPLPRNEHGDYPDGSLITNIIDLSKFTSEMIRGIKGKGQLLSSRNYTTLFTSQLNDSHYPDGRNNSMFNDEYNYSVFWGRNHAGYIIHNGYDDGVTANVLINPRSGIGTIAFSNIGDNVFGEVIEIVSKWEQKMK